MLTYALVCCALGFLFGTKFPQSFPIFVVVGAIKNRFDKNITEQNCSVIFFCGIGQDAHLRCLMGLDRKNPFYPIEGNARIL